MWFLFLLAVLAVLALLFWLAADGRRLRTEAARPAKKLASWPSVGMVVPCAGTHPDMESALRSLIEQNYKGELRCCLVTACADEPAARLADRLSREYGSVIHVVAGRADGCGQKNHNSLQGVAALGDGVDVYAFCDSTHLASPDFLSRLVHPLASGEAVFATGYHEVVPGDSELVTLAYTLCVLCMRIMQGMSSFTQPWGGAMAIERATFHEQGIGAFWADNVVDDCSLTTFLREKNIRVHLCPGALLRTRAGHHNGDVWRAWLDRQILFLKFCVPSQWRLLGVLLCWMGVIPPLALLVFLAWIAGAAGFPMAFVVGIYLLGTAVSLSLLRPLMPHHVRLLRLMGAFWLTCLTACQVYMKTVMARGILWHGIWYDVGRAGKVLSVKRQDGQAF